MYENVLTQSGLSENQATIYEILLKIGPSTARKVSENSPLKRPLTYKVLDELEQLGLVAKKEEPSKIAVFEPLHPTKLNELIERHVQKDLQAKQQLETIMGQLVSDFNLVSGKPGVRFYEGKEGFNKVAEDSLRSRTEILTYIDNEAVAKYFAEENKQYVKHRQKLGIKKRMITIDSDYIRAHARGFNPDLTQVRVIPQGYPFVTVMQIYDNKVSYITLDPEKTVGIIIEDPHIYQMHKTLFEYTWTKALPLTETPKPPDATAHV